MSDAPTFTCAMCGGTYERAVSDEDAQAEYEAVFGKYAVAEREIVCDDCYQVLVPDGVPYPDLLTDAPTRDPEPDGSALS